MVWDWLTHDADTKSVATFRAALYKPPPGVRPDYMRALPEWSPAAQGQQFMAALAAKGNRGNGALKMEKPDNQTREGG